MSARTFPVDRIGTTDTGNAALGYRIRCACGAVCFYPLKRGVKRRRPESIPTHFRSYGWLVGTTDRKDRCPECQKRAATTPEETATMTTTQKGPVATVVPLKAEPPPEMSRADRQIVFAKISDHYTGEAYCAGWTDKRVADDLNVPLAWVREVRDQFFGAEGSNPLLDDFLKAKADFDREYMGVIEMRKRHVEEGAALRRRYDDLDGKARDLAALAKRVEKEIGR